MAKKVCAAVLTSVVLFVVLNIVWKRPPPPTTPHFSIAHIDDSSDSEDDLVYHIE